MNLFTRGFDYYIKKSLRALTRLDGKAASKFLQKAIEADENGFRKVEYLAWQRISDDSYHLINDYSALSLFALFLNFHKPSSCIGWLASAKVALQIDKYDEFEPCVERADSLISALAAEEIIWISISIYSLYVQYSNAKYRAMLLDSMAAINEMRRITNRVAEYHKVVIERIERADKEIKLNPNVWKHYRALCNAWPPYTEKVAYAERKLQEG